MQFDAVRFCKDYNIDYRTEGKNVSSGWVGINDPYTIDTGFHLGINPEKGYAYSWKTGGHNLQYLIRTLLNVSSQKAQDILDDYRVLHNHVSKAVEYKPFTISEKPTEARHRNYLRHRGFNAKYLVEKYDIRSDNDNIVIPIYFHQDIVCYQSRNIYKKVYMFPSRAESIIPAKEILYNLDNCNEKYIIIVEGVFDVFRLGDNSASTFGMEYSHKQISILAEKYETVIIMFDNEKQAQKQARKLGAELSMLGVNVLIDNYLAECNVKDAGELTNKQVMEYKARLV